MTTKYTQYPYLHRGKNSAYRTNVSSHEPIHGNERLNWSIFGAWILILFACLWIWAGVAASLIQVYSWLQ